VYKAVLNRGTAEEGIASSERSFCSKCSTMLWLYDDTWCADPPAPCFLYSPCIPDRPELLHPFASAIDEPPLKDPGTLVRALLNAASLCAHALPRRFAS